MGRRARAAAMKRFQEKIDRETETGIPVLSVLIEEIIPTTLPFMFCASAYVFTLHNKLLGNLLPVLLRESPFLILLLHIYFRGRKNDYANWIFLAIAVSMFGDYFMMTQEEANFLTGMTIYTMMHCIYIIGLGFEFISKYAFIAALCVACLWNVLLLPHLTGYFCYLVPPYITLISVTFWRGFSQRGLGNDWTKACGAMGTLFLLCSDLNFSLNVFYVSKPYDHQQILTMELYFVGQLFMALSTFKRREQFLIIIEGKRKRR